MLTATVDDRPMTGSLPFFLYFQRRIPKITVGIYKMKKSWFDDDHWFRTPNGMMKERKDFNAFPMYVDIPDRFHPKETPEGSISVQCDGVGYLLDEVLGSDMEKKPAIVWADKKYGYLHRVRLEEVPTIGYPR